MDGESELDMTKRHVARGRLLIDAQHVRIAVLERDGQDAGRARDLLATLETTQRLHEGHMARLLRQAGLEH